MIERRARAQVVLLAGLPHGGTTITNILLGQHLAVFSAGDLERFPHKQLNGFCSCGEPASECPFWLDIRKRVAAFEGHDELLRMAFLYETICQQSGSRYVVDVCHDAQRVQKLLKNPHVDFRIIHLIRDGKAVLYSRLRLDYKTNQINSFGLKHLIRAFQTTRKWRGHLSSIKKISNNMECRTLQICYEDICRHPVKSLEQIGKLLDLDYGKIQRDLSKGYRLSQVAHLIRGKPPLRQVREVVLSHDTRYLREMKLVDRSLFYLLGGRMGRAHVFRDFR